LIELFGEKLVSWICQLSYFKILQSIEASPVGTSHVGFVVDKVALGQVFSEYFGFPCQSSFHQLLHNHHHLSSGAGAIAK
jgi:hypothetical protein